MTLKELKDSIIHLTPGEKAQVLQWVARDLGGVVPGIDSTPGVSGDEACIVRARIPVWVLVQMRRLGSSESDLLRAYLTKTRQPSFCASG